jgi:hypothetical protein
MWKNQIEKCRYALFLGVLFSLASTPFAGVAYTQPGDNNADGSDPNNPDSKDDHRVRNVLVGAAGAAGAVLAGRKILQNRRKRRASAPSSETQAEGPEEPSSVSAGGEVTETEFEVRPRSQSLPDRLGGGGPEKPPQFSMEKVSRPPTTTVSSESVPGSRRHTSGIFQAEPAKIEKAPGAERGHVKQKISFMIDKGKGVNDPEESSSEQRQKIEIEKRKSELEELRNKKLVQERRAEIENLVKVRAEKVAEAKGAIWAEEMRRLP